MFLGAKTQKAREPNERLCL